MFVSSAGEQPPQNTEAKTFKREFLKEVELSKESICKHASLHSLNLLISDEILFINSSYFRVQEKVPLCNI